MITLFDDNIQTATEYANQLILKGIKEPVYKIQINSLDFVNRHISFELLDIKKGCKFTSKELYSSGLYAIFENCPTVYNDACLYVGSTDNSIYDRIRRFLQGATGTLRSDENHSAGTLCKNHGIDFHTFYVKFLPKSKFPISSNKNIDDRYIDMYIAPQLQSRFNKKIKK